MLIWTARDPRVLQSLPPLFIEVVVRFFGILKLLALHIRVFLINEELLRNALCIHGNELRLPKAAESVSVLEPHSRAGMNRKKTKNRLHILPAGILFLVSHHFRLPIFTR